MPRNLEIKARIDSAQQAHTTAQLLNAQYIGVLHQTDTYFCIPKGRLKLREIDNSHSELLYYQREEISSQRVSNYEVHVVQDVSSLKRILECSMGLLAVVLKARTLFLYNGARIHIDEVTELGSFLEFEVPILESQSSAKQEMDFLIGRFNIKREDFITHSYLDLTLELNKTY